MQRYLLFVLWKTLKQVTTIKPNSLCWIFSIATPLSLFFFFFCSCTTMFFRGVDQIFIFISSPAIYLQPLQYGSCPQPQEIGLVRVSDDFDGVKSGEYFMDLILTSQQHLIQPKPLYHYSFDWRPWHPTFLHFLPIHWVFPWDLFPLRLIAKC